MHAALAPAPPCAGRGHADAHRHHRASIATSLPQNGDPSGVRKRLADHGITYNLIYTNDVLSNLSGGNKRGTIDQGKLEEQLKIDLEKFAGLERLDVLRQRASKFIIPAASGATMSAA